MIALPVQKSAVTYGTRIKKVTKFDLASSLLHAICRKYHNARCKDFPQNQYRLLNGRWATYDSRDTSTHILHATLWHKYENQIDDELR